MIANSSVPLSGLFLKMLQARLLPIENSVQMVSQVSTDRLQLMQSITKNVPPAALSRVVVSQPALVWSPIQKS